PRHGRRSLPPLHRPPAAERALGSAGAPGWVDAGAGAARPRAGGARPAPPRPAGRLSVRDAVHLYLRFAATSMRAQMQYRASFVLFSLAQFLGIGVEFLGVWALVDRFGAVRGWRLAEVALLFGMVNISFALAESFGRGFDMFSAMVKKGEFDR